MYNFSLGKRSFKTIFIRKFVNVGEKMFGIHALSPLWYFWRSKKLKKKIKWHPNQQFWSYSKPFQNYILVHSSTNQSNAKFHHLTPVLVHRDDDQNQNHVDFLKQIDVVHAIRHYLWKKFLETIHTNINWLGYQLSIVSHFFFLETLYCKVRIT